MWSGSAKGAGLTSTGPAPGATARPQLRAIELRELCLAAGADDVGFVALEDPAVADQRADILEVLPGTATIASMVFRLNRHNLRSPLHSTADGEFQQVSGYANRTGRAVVSRLSRLGIRAVNMPVGFPFETGRWPGKMWPVADKPVAEAAGVGRMGWHRCVIHPEFGSAVTLGTVLGGRRTRYVQQAPRRQSLHRVQAVRVGVSHGCHRGRRTLRLRLLLHAQLP